MAIIQSTVGVILPFQEKPSVSLIYLALSYDVIQLCSYVLTPCVFLSLRQTSPWLSSLELSQRYAFSLPYHLPLFEYRILKHSLSSVLGHLGITAFCLYLFFHFLQIHKSCFLGSIPIFLHTHTEYSLP